LILFNLFVFFWLKTWSIILHKNSLLSQFENLGSNRFNCWTIFLTLFIRKTKLKMLNHHYFKVIQRVMETIDQTWTSNAFHLFARKEYVNKWVQQHFKTILRLFCTIEPLSGPLIVLTTRLNERFRELTNLTLPRVASRKKLCIEGKRILDYILDTNDTTIYKTRTGLAEALGNKEKIIGWKLENYLLFAQYYVLLFLPEISFFY